MSNTAVVNAVSEVYDMGGTVDYDEEWTPRVFPNKSYRNEEYTETTRQHGNLRMIRHIKEANVDNLHSREDDISLTEVIVGIGTEFTQMTITYWNYEHQNNDDSNGETYVDDTTVTRSKEVSRRNTDGSVKVVTAHNVGQHIQSLKCTDVLLDSGANVLVCSPQLVEILKLKVIQCKYPMKIEFADGTRSSSSLYVYLGPFLGNTYLLPGVVSIIASGSKGNCHGFDIRFTHKLTCIIYSTDDVVLIEAPIREEDELYDVDVRYVID